ncbi:MAG: hypothetical protein HY976_01220 [Candidatus Kerfeldbacteria bacterium]|nr:hypothetical protein [Candidatus Kerfeldbacteria bacterium]
MMNPQRLQQLDLAERATLVEVANAVEEIVQFDLHVEAFEMLKALDQRLRFVSATEIGPLAFEYDQLMVKLRIVAWPDLSEKDALDVIRTHLVDFFSTEIELSDKLKQRIVMIPPADRDDFKKKIRDAMIKNEQLITSQPLVIGEAPPQSSTVANWIKDYTFHVGSDIVLPNKLSEYFSHGKNISLLNENERNRVVKMLREYERLKFPSEVVEGFDAPATLNIDEKVYIAVDGQVVALQAESPRLLPSALPTAARVGRKFDSQEIERTIQRLNASRAAEDETRYTEEEQMLEAVGTETDKVLDVITAALMINDHEKLVTALSVLARSGNVDNVFSRKAIVDAFVNEFVKPLADNQGQPVDRIKRHLTTNTSNSKLLAAFMQWLLTRSLHGNEGEAARIGNRLENTLAALGQTDFVGMTYFDVSQGTFRWTPLKINPDGSLSWVE